MNYAPVMLRNNHSRRYRFLYSVVVVVDGVEMPAEEVVSAEEAVSNVVHTSFVAALHYYLVAAEEDVQAYHDLVGVDIDMVEEPRMLLVDIAADIVAAAAAAEDTCPAADKEDWHAVVVGMGSYY